jgi:hypothetical protein
MGSFFLIYAQFTLQIGAVFYHSRSINCIQNGISVQ